jgi:hypothetical protein
MRCDSWTSFLAHTLASPCLGYKPEARVATLNYGMDEVKNNPSHGIFWMIVWEHLKPIGNFEGKIGHDFKYATRIILCNIELKHPFWKMLQNIVIIS